MFTGIITNIGKIKQISEKNDQIYYEIESEISSKLNLGDSVAVDGICLTVTDSNSKSFEIQAMTETLKLTNLNQKIQGSKVNLEKPLRFDQGIDGHIVQGHVDEVGFVIRSQRQPDKNWVIEIEPPKEIFKYIVYKGSITINGVSLTVSKENDYTFEVSLIDYTLQNTNLCDLKKGDLVNLEIDVIARYLEKINKFKQ